jgi:hypothetical protein
VPPVCFIILQTQIALDLRRFKAVCVHCTVGLIELSSNRAATQLLLLQVSRALLPSTLYFMPSAASLLQRLGCFFNAASGHAIARRFYCTQQPVSHPVRVTCARIHNSIQARTPLLRLVIQEYSNDVFLSGWQRTIEHRRRFVTGF